MWQASQRFRNHEPLENSTHLAFDVPLLTQLIAGFRRSGIQSAGILPSQRFFQQSSTADVAPLYIYLIAAEAFSSAAMTTFRRRLTGGRRVDG